MSLRFRRADGFTLVELVVVIVLTAIVASFMVLFLDAPMQSYFAQTRRSDLTDSANRITSAVAADVRTALPNSLRTNAAGTALELLATTGAARYYGQGDKHGGTGELTIGNSVAAPFGTLDSFTKQAVAYRPSFLSIGNLGNASYNAYNSATGVMTGTGTQITVDPNPGPPFVAGENQVTLTGASMTFLAPGAPATQPSVHNAYLVSGPVSYVCNPNPGNPAAGTVMRYSGYAVSAAQPVPPGGGAAALIAHDVAACTMSFVAAPAGYPYGQLAIVRVTLSSNGETLQVFFEVPTEFSQ